MSVSKKTQYNAQKKTFYATEVKTERGEHLRFLYWQVITGCRVEDLVFIDETGLNLAMTKIYARSLKGQRAVGTKPLKRGENLTLIGAVSKKGVLNTFTVNGGTTGQVFKVYVEKVLVPSLWPGAIVVMDNLPAHKVEGVEKMIKAAGAGVIYLSPYSPDFNPIENLRSEIKRISSLSRSQDEGSLRSGY